MKKRLLSSLLCVVLMVSVMSQVSFTARADISNMCGEEATWTLNDIGDLFILGNGVMYDYTRNSAPWNVKNVVNIAVVEGVKGIGKYAFCDCMCLKSAEIAESVEYINSGAFYNCHSMTDIILPKYMSSIGDVAFSGCSSLKSIVIPKGVATIKPGTFSSCTSLKSIVIPDGVTIIEGSAFRNCGLNFVELPETVTNIGAGAFQDCDYLMSVDMSTRLKSIGVSSFEGCDNLKTVEIPSGATSIGSFAFRNCHNLERVTIPNGVTSIGNDAFRYCPKLVIECEEYSVAHQYAMKNNLKYSFINSENGNDDLQVSPIPDQESDSSDVGEDNPAKAEMNFTDVPKNAWYYEDLNLAYDAGLINGKTAYEFKPSDNMTYAEAIKLAACLHQKATTGKVSLTNGNPWYQTYVDYCKANGIINKDYNYNAPATRGGYMAIFANALPAEQLAEINKVDDNAIPDVKMDSPFAESVYKLYRAGVVGGSDAARSCKPNDNIKRSEVATILARMMFAEKRIPFTLEEAEDAQPTGLRLDYNKTTLTVGEVDYWTTTVYPEDANPMVTWSSSNPSVATVDQNGKVTAISPGEARISVITQNGIKEAITVTVIK